MLNLHRKPNSNEVNPKPLIELLGLDPTLMGVARKVKSPHETYSAVSALPGQDNLGNGRTVYIEGESRLKGLRENETPITLRGPTEHTISFKKGRTEIEFNQITGISAEKKNGHTQISIERQEDLPFQFLIDERSNIYEIKPNLPLMIKNDRRNMWRDLVNPWGYTKDASRARGKRDFAHTYNTMNEAGHFLEIITRYDEGGQPYNQAQFISNTPRDASAMVSVLKEHRGLVGGRTWPNAPKQFRTIDLLTLTDQEMKAAIADTLKALKATG